MVVYAVSQLELLKGVNQAVPPACEPACHTCVTYTSAWSPSGLRHLLSVCCQVSMFFQSQTFKRRLESPRKGGAASSLRLYALKERSVLMRLEAATSVP